jgi:hypothetical protein
LLKATLSLPAASVGEGVMAEAVVGGALLLIAEHGISLAALLEALFGLVIIGVTIRMIL